jgi:hypothetical protein
MTEEASYEEEMALGRRCLEDRQWSLAYSHFGKAHGLGHAVLAHHRAAHRGLIRAAWRAGRIDRAALNVLLLAGAYLFDKDEAPTPSTL